MSTQPTTITTTVHLDAGSPRERQVRVRALVSLFEGRYRIDKLDVLDGGHLTERELGGAYDHIIDQARAYYTVPDGARNP